MSVINQMLQDLEQRRQPEPEIPHTDPLHGVKAVTTSPFGRRLAIGLLASLVLVMTALLLWQYIKPTSKTTGATPVSTASQQMDAPARTPDAVTAVESVVTVTEQTKPPISAIKDWVIQRDRAQNRLLIELNRVTDYKLLMITSDHLQVRFSHSSLLAAPELSLDNSLLRSVHAQRQAGDVVVDIHTLEPVRSQAAMTEYAQGAGFSLTLQAVNPTTVLTATTPTPDSVATPPHAPTQATSQPTQKVQRPETQRPESRLPETQVRATTESVNQKPARIQIQARAPSAQELSDQSYHRALNAPTPAQFERYLRQALKHDSAHRQARLALAAMLLHQGRPSEAHQLIEQGLEIYPAQSELLQLQAQWLMRQQRYQEADRVLQKVIDGDAGHYALRASIAQRLQQPQRAAQFYETALQMDNRQAAWWLGLAIAHEGQARPVAARHAYARALQLGGLASAANDYAQQRYMKLRQQTQEP